MYPTQHAAATLLAAALLRRRGWGAANLAAFAAGSALLDVDHYLSYVARTGDFSLRRAYWWNRDRGEGTGKAWLPHVPYLGFEWRRPFHWPPLVLAPLIVALIVRRRLPAAVPLLGALAAGAVFHRALDAAWEGVWSSDLPPPPKPLPPAMARAVRRAETAALGALHVVRSTRRGRLPW